MGNETVATSPSRAMPGGEQKRKHEREKKGHTPKVKSMRGKQRIAKVDRARGKTKLVRQPPIKERTSRRKIKPSLQHAREGRTSTVVAVAVTRCIQGQQDKERTAEQ
eukprot:4659258-Amphidinium_carterae.1